MGPMGPSFSQEGVFKIIVCTVLIRGTNGTSGTIIFSTGRAQNCHMCCSNLLAQWYQWDHHFLERESSALFHVLYWWDQWEHLFQHRFMYCTNGTNRTIFWGDWGRVWNCIMYFTDLWDQWYHYFLGMESSKSCYVVYWCVALIYHYFLGLESSMSFNVLYWSVGPMGPPFCWGGRSDIGYYCLKFFFYCISLSL
jgi:hypothetical protein